MNSDQRLIFVGYFLLLLHNLCFLGRFLFADWGLSFVTSYLDAIQPDYWILFVIESMIVFAFFADIVIGFDKKKRSFRSIGILFTLINGLFYLAKIVPWYFGKLFVPLAEYTLLN